MTDELAAGLYVASVWVLPVLVAITFHEAAHGYVAWRLGDDTAYRLGRVSFNPIRHIDLVGTILLPAMLLWATWPRPFLFGWAKPVPVDFRRLRRPRIHMVWVAAAGPAANIILAVASAFLIHLAVMAPGAGAAWLVANLTNSMIINVILAVFNMLPLPPLDGGRVAVGLLPVRLARPLARLERYGLFIVIGVVFLVPWLGRSVGVDLAIFVWLVLEPAHIVLNAIATLAGVK